MISFNESFVPRGKSKIFHDEQNDAFKDYVAQSKIYITFIF